MFNPDAAKRATETATLNPISQPCLNCLQPFQPKKPESKFCCNRCRTQHHSQTTHAPISQLITISEAALQLGLSESCLRRRIKTGQIKAIRKFGRILIHKSSLLTDSRNL